MTRFDALVLAGGAGRRVGGADKAMIDVGGMPLVERALGAVAAASTRVVVGPTRHLPDDVVQVRERPPGGGPVAAVEAGLSRVTSDIVVVFACDLPFVTGEIAAALVAGARSPGVDGALLVDEAGRRQPLTAAYRTAPLRAALSRLDQAAGSSMRHLIGPLTLVETPSDPWQTTDCDTWEDVARSRERWENS